MNVINTQLLRNFLVRPLLKNVIFDRFNIGDLVHGRIIQALPKKNLFVLQTRGMNLIANTHLSLFIGDRVTGKVINVKDQIELKLVKVNGKSVRQNMKISEDGLVFARIPLSDDRFGKDTFVEIYADKDYEEQNNHQSTADRCRLIITSDELKNIIIHVALMNSELYLSTWIENQELYQFIRENMSGIEQNLYDDHINKVNLNVLPLQAEVSHFRKSWAEELHFDIRA